jgi:23S rRNA (adenine2030-N6)-methyltransferase
MNYRHAFHAGNFADVLKHMVLMAVIQTLHKKEKPFFIMDTHAGIGRYDLESSEAFRSPEYTEGILPLWQAYKKSHTEFPPLLKSYLTFLEKLNKNAHQSEGFLRFYAGSPLFIQHLIRSQDRAVLCEKHPDDANRLFSLLKGIKNMHLKEGDGYNTLLSYLPPREIRGAVIIDPPFEERNEFQVLFKTIKNALHRWKTGIFVIWYPVKDEQADLFEKEISTLRPQDRIDSFAEVYSLKKLNQTSGLNETRMMVIHPPYPSHDQIKECIPVLGRILTMKTEMYSL